MGGCWLGPDPKGEGGGVCGPQNGCMGQWILWAPEAPEILFKAYGWGNFFVLTNVAIFKILRILWRIQKWKKKTF